MNLIANLGVPTEPFRARFRWGTALVPVQINLTNFNFVYVIHS